MAETTAAERVTQWDSDFFTSYIRGNRFKKYMGTDENAVIQIKEDLTKKKGDSIVINLVGALDDSAGPNDGTTTLVNNELALPNDGYEIKVKVVRQATVVNVEEEQASPIGIRNAGKTALKDLSLRYMKKDIVNALHSINGVKYATSSQAQRDAWLADNSDRVLFGGSKANNSGNDHSASLANIAVDDKLTGRVVSQAKRIAQQAKTANGDGIRPFKYGEDNESYLYFVSTDQFRDLREWMEANGKWEQALERSTQNPLYTGGTSIEWDGVLVREIPEIENLGAVGNTGAVVAPGFLCGAQALGVVWAQRTKTTVRSEDDYQFRYGVGFLELRGIEKIQWGQGGDAVDWAVVTVYNAAAPDA